MYDCHTLFCHVACVVPGIVLVRSLAQVPSYCSVVATHLKPTDQQPVHVPI